MASTAISIPTDISVSEAKLPVVYESAKLALTECSRIDECKDWANKAEALASYAKQSEDKSLLTMAVRIQARAIRRCGELLKEIQPASGGDRGNGATGGRPPIAATRTQVAQEAGLSSHQQKTAIRVANVEPTHFESLVESEAPPTVTKLAEIGTKTLPKPLIELNGRRPEDFSQSTQGQGAIERFAKVAAEIDPAAIIRGASAAERLVIQQRIENIAAWLEQLQQELEDFGHER
jgi:hypothetical protein